MKSPAKVDFIRESIITFLSDSLDKIAAFTAFVYFANYFTTGAFGAAYTVIGMSMMAGSAPKSVGTAIAKRVSEDTRLHDRYFLLGISSILAYTALVSLVVAVASRLFASPLEHLAFAGLVHLATRPILYHVERVFDGIGDTGFAATLDFFDGVLTAVLRFVLILGVGLGEEGLLYSAAISSVVIGGLAYYLKFGIPTTLPSRSAVRDIRGYTSWSLVARVGSESFQNAATVLAGLLVSPTLASWIKSAQTLTMPARIPVRSVIQSIFVQVSGDLERDELSVTPLQNGIDVAAIIAIPLVAGAFVLGDEVMVTLYGTGYGNTGHILTAIAAAAVFDSYARIFISTLNGFDRPDASAFINSTHALVYSILFALALGIGGTEVFLGMFIVAYLTWAGSGYWFVNRLVLDTGELSWKFVLEQGVVAVTMAIVVTALTSLTEMTSWFDLVGPVAVGAIVYGFVLLVISSRCRSILRVIIRRVHF